jgi:formate hydrogenlyase subunit 3/multisubunit Na+/H+ antiporter MnhD subunit
VEAELILLPMLIPGILGLATLFLPGRLRAVPGFLGSLATLAAGLALVGTGESYSHSWLAFGPLNLDFAFRVDGFTGWLSALVGLCVFFTALYAADFFRGRGGAPGRFYAYLLIAAAGAEGVILTENLLLLVLCWEIVTLMLFLLVITGSPEGAPAAAKAFTILGFGDVALILGTVLLASRGLARPLDFATLAANPLATGDFTGILTFLLLFAGAAAKAGAVPLHTWIPTMSGPASPPVMALLPASLDKVLGIYLLVRASVSWVRLSPGLQFAVMTVGAVTILAGVLMAMVQHDVKRLLSFHAVSQVGYMVLGIGTGTLVGVLGGVFHMVNNAIYKACLFFGAGAVEREAGTRDLGKLGGLHRSMPVTFLCMFVAALSISGVPPLNGFVSKWLVYQACVAARQPLFLVAALFGSVLTLASFVKVLHSMFWGARPPTLDGVKEAGIGMRLPMVALAVLCVLLGVFAWAPLDQAIGPVKDLPAASAALSGGLDAAGTFRPGVVTILLVIGVLAGILLAHLGGARSRRTRSVFIGGEALDREVNRFPGTEFYRTIHEMPLLGRTLDAGDRGAFDVYTIFGKLGGGVIRGLRSLHTGVITDYLFWCLLGLSAVLAVFFWG